MSLFFPVKAGNLSLSNRFIRSATGLDLSNPNGSPKPELFDVYKNLARGEIGLIITGFVYPIDSGRATSKQSGFSSRFLSEKYRPIVSDVHKNGGKIVFQVCHGGCGTLCSEKISPSDFKEVGGREIKVSEIEELITSFGRAAMMAQTIGADGLQIHAAHGYLLSEFLTPRFNRRTDKYGGSVENRVRIIQEIIKEIRRITKPGFSLSIKINGSDGYDGKGMMTPELCAEYVSKIKGLDFYEISSSLGILDSNIPDHLKPSLLGKKIQYPKFQYNLPYAEYIKKQLPEINVATVGGHRNVHDMQEIVSSGKADLVSLSTPFIKNPFVVRDMKNGKITKC